MQDQPEPREPAPDAIIDITYVEFDGPRLSLVEWREDGKEEKFSGYADDDDSPIPAIVRAALAQSITA